MQLTMFPHDRALIPFDNHLHFLRVVDQRKNLVCSLKAFKHHGLDRQTMGKKMLKYQHENILHQKNDTPFIQTNLD